MLQFVTHLLEKCDKGTDRAQLLVIVSDGRGVFSEGKDEVQRAVSLSKLAGILTVFVILDSPNSKVRLFLYNAVLKLKIKCF